MKLSKPQIKQHEQACRLLEKETLTMDDRIFVIENWNEGAKHMNSKMGAFFTPWDLANQFQFSVRNDHTIIDLCAGIGSLSLSTYLNYYQDGGRSQRVEPKITCVELCKEYYEVGKKVLPEATWILGSILDEELISNLGTFKTSISNPPFGNIQTAGDIKLNYTGAEFELKTIEVASRISELGAFILPQGSTPFIYSGSQQMQQLSGTHREPRKVKKFVEQTGIEFCFNIGIDTTPYKDQWKNVSPTVEIIEFEFE